jgi:glycerol-3-phosphate dehydrogenase
MLEGLLVGPLTNLYKKFNQIPLNVNNEEINALIEESKKILLNLDHKYSNSIYGIRTINDYGDFFIKHEKPNNRIIQLIGISSPDLTAAPAIADFIFDIM